jgi:allantoinase
MSAAPARLVGLEHRKGHLRAGHDADVVVWDPSAEFIVDPAKLLHRHHLTPYAGRRLRGVVRATLVGGKLAFGAL